MKKNNTIIGSALLVMIVMLLSKCMGFIRQVVIANTYGANSVTDIYFISSEFMLGLSGALLASLTTALITIYIDVSVKKSKNDANAVASKMLTLFLFAGGLFILLTNLFMPFIAKLLAPSYDAALMSELIKYLRIFSVTFIFTAFQSIYAAVLNANNSFVPGKLYGIVYNPIAIFSMLLLSRKIGINALVFAYFAGNIAQTLLLKQLCKNTFNFKPSVNFADEHLKQLILLSLPLLVSNIFIQLNNVIDKAICSMLGEGIASNYSYAFTLEQFVSATITATLSLILLSHYAKYAAENNTKMLVKTFKESLGGLIILLVPISLVACTMSYDIVSSVYLRGEFTQSAAEYTSQALIGFGLGFALVAIREMYIRVHLSFQNTRMPMIANIVSVILNAVMSIALANFIGILGISLATTLSVIVAIIMLNKSVKRYIPDFKFISMGILIAKVLISCAVSFFVIILLKNIPVSNTLIRFIIASAGGLGIYIIMLILLRCDELLVLINNTRLQIKNKLKK